MRGLFFLVINALCHIGEFHILKGGVEVEFSFLADLN